MRRVFFGSLVVVALASNSNAFAGETAPPNNADNAQAAQSNEELLHRLKALEMENASLRSEVHRLKNNKQVERMKPERHSVPVSAAGSVPLSATTAYASAPMPASSFNWTGFYVGAHAGYASVAVQTPGQDPGNLSDTHPTGGFGGGQFGYNYQFAPNWVVGAEVDASLAASKGTAIEPDPLVPTTLLAFYDTIDYLGTLHGRLGYTWGRDLVYATGGLAWGHNRIIFANSSSNIQSADAMHVGWTTGGGVEHVLAGNWTGKIEYLYFHLGDKNYQPTSGAMFAHSVIGLTAQTVKVGVNYLFH